MTTSFIFKHFYINKLSFRRIKKIIFIYFIIELIGPCIYSILKYEVYYIFSMQFTQNFNQINSEEVAIKDIADKYIKICENTQYLTNIIRHQQGRVFKLYSPDLPNVQMKSFYNLIVQSAFLLYTCCIKRVPLFFSKNLFIAYQKDGGLQVLRQFIFEAEYQKLDQKKMNNIKSNFIYVDPSKHDNAYSQHVLDFIRSYIKVIQEYKEKNYKDKKNQTDKTIFESIKNAQMLLRGVLDKNIKAKILITCLEETQLFRTYSYLLKTLNCSIYQAIRKTGKMEEVLCDIKRKQITLQQGVKYMLQQNPIVYQNLQKLQSSVEDFIKYLIKMRIIQMEVSVSNSASNSFDSTKDKNNAKFGVLQVHKNGDRVYSWKILVQQKKLRQINKKTITQLTQGQTTQLSNSEEAKDNKKHQNLFYIQYMSNKNLISVWYISNIQVNIQNSDPLIYHCNNMTLEINNLTVDYTERQSNKTHRRKQKVLAFKVVTHFNIRQNPFINILLLIDRAMIYGKVCQPEISKKTSKSEDYSRFSTVGKRIHHLSNLFIKKIRRSYENVTIKGHDN